MVDFKRCSLEVFGLGYCKLAYVAMPLDYRFILVKVEIGSSCVLPPIRSLSQVIDLVYLRPGLRG
jgi:hypothetical protein